MVTSDHALSRTHREIAGAISVMQVPHEQAGQWPSRPRAEWKALRGLDQIAQTAETLSKITGATFVMKFAYADPPYLGMGKMYADLHPDAMAWDDPATHRALIERLCAEYGDGWLMSATSTSLRTILPMCPPDCRVLAWCKPFVAFKDKTLAYAWEPVIKRGGRKRSKDEETQRDYFVGNNPPRINKPDNFVPGMKPRAFCRWLFAVLNAKPGDALDDLFPGSGAVAAAWSEWVGEQSPMPQLPLEAAMNQP